MSQVALIIEDVGRKLCDPSANPFYREYENDDEVFYHLLITLLHEKVEKPESLMEEFKRNIAEPEILWKRFEEKMKDEDFRRRIEGELPFEESDLAEIAEMLCRSKDPEVELTVTGWVFASTSRGDIRGIFGILKLWKELKDQGYGLRRLYEYFEDKYGPEALEMLISRLKEISGIGEVRALRFLREYAIKSGHRSLLRELPIPDQSHIKRVMKRLGLVESGKIGEVRDFGRKFFEEPIIAATALEFIGEKYCRPRDPLCMECPLKDHCERSLDE